MPLILGVGLLSFAHGANDVGNAVGPLAAIVSTLSSDGDIASKVSMTLWALIVGAFRIAIGLALFGPKLITTVGEKLRAYIHPALIVLPCHQPSPSSLQSPLACLSVQHTSQLVPFSAWASFVNFLTARKEEKNCQGKIPAAKAARSTAFCSVNCHGLGNHCAGICSTICDDLFHALAANF